MSLDPVFRADDLRPFIRQLMVSLNTGEQTAGLMADSLVAAHVRGVDSHGLQLVPFYTAQIEDGRVDARETGATVSESGAVLVYDGRNGLGQPIAEDRKSVV